MFLKIIAYALGSGLGYLLAAFLPETPATPYIPLLLSYHIFLLFLIVKARLLSEQKVGLSMSLPMVFISHCACVAGLVGMVVCRHEVPVFRLLQYAVPALAPFEVKWLFEGAKTPRASEPEPESGRMPECSNDEYTEFLNCMRRGERKFQTAGRTVQEEYAAWLKDHRNKLARTKPAEEKVQAPAGSAASAG